MQYKFRKAAQIKRLVFSVLVFFSLVFVSCKSENLTNSGLIEGSDIVIDTLFVNNIVSNAEEIYTGGLQRFYIGQYDDALFGSLSTTSYLRPRIANLSGNDTLNSNWELKLELTFEKNNAFGDTTAPVNVSIYNITEQWRSTAVTSESSISYDNTTPVGSFQYSSDKDSLIVDLSQDLLLNYAQYVNSDDTEIDSVYNEEFFGVALVSDNSSAQMVSLNTAASRFLLINPDRTDTLTVSFLNRAYTIEGDINSVTDRITLSSSLKNYYELNLESLSSNFRDLNLLKAELIFIEDTLAQRNSLPQNHVRPGQDFVDLKFPNDLDEVYGLQFEFGSIDYASLHDSARASYTFDITNHINSYVYSNPDEKRLFLTLGSRENNITNVVGGGVIRATTLFDETANTANRPKLILIYTR